MKKNCMAAVWAGAAALVVCLAVRVYQIVGCTDMTSGFLYHDNGFFGSWGYYTALVLTAAALAVCAFLGEKRGNAAELSDVVDARAAVLGFTMLLTGVCAIYDGVTELSAFTPSKLIIVIDFALGAAISAAAFVTLYKKEFTPALGFSYCTGAVYFMLRGVTVFLERMAITTVPEYLLECLSDIMLSAVFMLAAKYLSGNEAKRTRSALFVWGGTTAVLTLSEGLGIIIAHLTAPAEVAARITMSRYAAEFFRQEAHGRDAYMLTYMPWVNIAAGLFAAALVVVLALKAPKAAQASELPVVDEQFPETADVPPAEAQEAPAEAAEAPDAQEPEDSAE